jgi:hypothetical protein
MSLKKKVTTALFWNKQDEQSEVLHVTCPLSQGVVPETVKSQIALEIVEIVKPEIVLKDLNKAN